MRRWLIALNLVLVVAIVVVALWRGTVPSPSVAPGGEFTLNGKQGPVALNDFKGKLVLLYFGYTFCPDICPTSLVVWSQALNALTEAERARVQPIFVSVDPERDTPERLAEYTAFFHPAIIGLSGTPERLREVASRYGAFYARQENVSAGGYVIDHTAASFVIDAEGRLVASIPHATPPDQFVAMLRQHLPKH